MTVQDPTPAIVVPQPAPPSPPPSPPPARPGFAASAIRYFLGAQIFLLLALAQILFAGYRVGVGNQSIQIPFLKHFIDPQLYANDPMLRQTLADYPSYFFRLLAPLVAHFDLYSVYFTLHVLTAAATLAAAYALGRAIFNSRATGAVLVLLMLAGHHRALAGDDLYSVGFTHTFAVFPLAIAAMALLYRGWHLAAFALVGVIFNLHALTAAYLLFMFLAWAVVFYRPRAWPWRLAGMLLLFAALAAPTVREMFQHRQVWGPEWLDHTRTRSADHSFPSTWWTDGATDIPRFVLLLGLAAVSLSFAARRDAQRKTLMIAAATGILFLAGWLFTDLLPISTVVRAQLFRSSRLIVVLMLAHLAHAIVQGLRTAARPLPSPDSLPRTPNPEPATPPHSDTPSLPHPVTSLPLLSRLLEPLLATAAFATLAIPGLFALAPWLLLASILVALINGRLAWPQSLAASLCLLIVAAAWRTIEYHIPGVDGRVSLAPFVQSLKSAGPSLALAAAVACAAYLLLRIPIGPRTRLCAAVAACFVCAAVGLRGARTLAASAPDEQRAWIDAQKWAAKNTPKSALFLTPPQQGGFRIRSDRSVVCEWRDGTQLYFSAAFARDWWDKLQALRPSATASSGLGDLLRAKTLETLSDQDIVKLAKGYGATYVVLPASTGQSRRDLKLAYHNAAWAIYEPRVLDKEDAYIENVAKPNIEKYRKSDCRLELADAAGRTLTDGQYEIRQTRQAFGFGVSIPFFADPPGTAGRDYEPPQVTPRELEMVKGVFNYSVIPFSAKWQRIEPEQGKWDFSELDKYVDWCTKNGVTMEFHYLGGFTPPWAHRLGQAAMKAAWQEHCRKTIARYQDRIKYWQITNDKYLVDWCADVIKETHLLYPHLKLGISDCSYFGGGSELTVGADEIEQIQAEGGRLDFFSTHGHKPMGMWFDLRTLSQCVDAFAKYGVKVHVSEATVDFGNSITGGNGKYDHWTPELVAEYYEKFYTVLFAHPAMEAINYWDLGPSVVRPFRGFGGISGTGQAGLLDPDKNDQPRPLYNTLKELITKRWRTNLDGQTPPDGALAFRGFHGDYEITVTTPAGKRLKATFTVTPEGPNTHQLKLTEAPAPIAKGS